MFEILIKAILSVILFIWQLPQTLVGLFLTGWYALYGGVSIKDIKTYPDLDNETGEVKKNLFCDSNYIMSVVGNKMGGAITLGQVVVFSKTSYKKQATIQHECAGHGKQSMMFGPLYLLVIGLPSILHCCFRTCRNYYHFWTEKWANELGDTSK
jgi:hypothetical protein